MAKAIVRINAFLGKKETKEVYNLIYDQVKAGLEIIIVPAYCDVYVLDGEDIEVQKEEKNDGETNYEKLAGKYCATCKYHYGDCACEIGGACTNYNRWEAKDDG